MAIAPPTCGTGVSTGEIDPKRSNELRPSISATSLYRERSVIGRTINRLKRFRRVATRYPTLDASYQAMITIACLLERL